jgi:hypothetical protein
MGKEGSVRFITDENISKRLVAILNKLGERSVESIYGTDYTGTPDEEWLPLVAERGYICISCDRRMTIESSIAPFLVKANVRAIYLSKHFANAKIWQQALWMLKYWHQIKSHAQTMKPGDLVKVLHNGKMKQITPVAKLQKVKTV